MESAFIDFLRLFDEEKFFEAHETLEILWRKTQTQERDFYHGLIQLAAVCVHIQRNNPQGAGTLYRKACHYLEKYLPAHEGIDLGALLQEIRQLLLSQGPFPKIRH